MRRFAGLVLVAIALTATGNSASKAQTQEKLPSLITVTGEGEVAIVPDLAILTGGVTTMGKTAREASEANAKAMSAVMGALKSVGIAEQDVQTSRVSLQPVRDNSRSDLGRIVSFHASNQVTIKVRELAKTADVVDRLVAAGANDISGIHFVVSAPSKPLDQAREAAIADARRKAEIYARAANVILGAPISITEEGSAVPGPVLMRVAKDAATPVSPGEEIQRVSVSVSFELKR